MVLPACLPLWPRAPDAATADTRHAMAGGMDAQYAGEMTEQNLPDPELHIVGEETPIPGEDEYAVPPELLGSDATGDRPDPDAVEGDADALQEGSTAGDAGDPEPAVDPESDQALRDETEEGRYEAGEEQVPPEVPTIGEAADDVDFGEEPVGEEADSSDDPANLGGSPLADFGDDDYA